MRTLAGREDCGDAADVTTVDGTTLGSTRECVLLYSGFTSISPFEITLTGFKDTCCPTHAYQFWRRCKWEKSPSKKGPDADGIYNVKSREGWESVYCMELGESDTHGCAQTTAPGSRSLVRRAVFWLLNCGMPSAQDHQDEIPVQLTEHRPHNLVNASKGENSTVDRSQPGSYQENQWPGTSVPMNVNSSSVAVFLEGISDKAEKPIQAIKALRVCKRDDAKEVVKVIHPVFVISRWQP